MNPQDCATASILDAIRERDRARAVAERLINAAEDKLCAVVEALTLTGALTTGEAALLLAAGEAAQGIGGGLPEEQTNAEPDELHPAGRLLSLFTSIRADPRERGERLPAGFTAMRSTGLPATAEREPHG